jgi:tRNA modification GTPase
MQFCSVIVILLMQILSIYTFRRYFTPSFTSISSKRFLSDALASDSQQDTIYALSSGPMVKCGVSVVRLSGPLSYYCMERLLKGGGTSTSMNTSFSSHVKALRPRQATLRKLYCPRTNDMLDQALLLWFPNPHSFTGDDVVELHLHGSRAVILGVFNALEHIDSTLPKEYQGSIRPAERGEFTRRAFDSGKMDLTAVEGLADLLEADTSEQRKQALKQMDGYMLETYERWR